MSDTEVYRQINPPVAQHHEGTIQSVMVFDDVQIRLECIKLAIMCEADDAYSGEGTLREEAEVIYDWVTQGAS